MTKIMDREERGDLEFDFVDCPEEDIVKLDQASELQEVPTADIGVFTPNDPCLIVEVKDPGNPHARTESRASFLDEMKTDTFLDKQVVNSSLNSRQHMVSLRPQRQRHLFIGVFGIAVIFHDARKVAVLLKIMQDSVNQIHSTHAQGHLMPPVRIVSEETWSQVAPQYPLRRLSTS